MIVDLNVGGVLIAGLVMHAFVALLVTVAVIRFFSGTGLHRLFAARPLVELATLVIINCAQLQIADEKHIMYGSDWPFTTDPVVAMLSKKIDETDLLTDEQRIQILGRNALKLLPRLDS